MGSRIPQLCPSHLNPAVVPPSVRDKSPFFLCSIISQAAPELLFPVGLIRIGIPGANQELSWLPPSVSDALGDSRAFQSLGKAQGRARCGIREGGMEKGPGAGAGASRQHLEHQMRIRKRGFFMENTLGWEDRDELWSARATGERPRPRHPLKSQQEFLRSGTTSSLKNSPPRAVCREFQEVGTESHRE